MICKRENGQLGVILMANSPSTLKVSHTSGELWPEIRARSKSSYLGKIPWISIYIEEKDHLELSWASCLPAKVVGPINSSLGSQTLSPNMDIIWDITFIICLPLRDSSFVHTWSKEIETQIEEIEKLISIPYITGDDSYANFPNLPFMSKRIALLLPNHHSFKMSSLNSSIVGLSPSWILLLLCLHMILGLIIPRDQFWFLFPEKLLDAQSSGPIIWLSLSNLKNWDYVSLCAVLFICLRHLKRARPSFIQIVEDLFLLLFVCKPLNVIPLPELFISTYMKSADSSFI